MFIHTMQAVMGLLWFVVLTLLCFWVKALLQFRRWFPKGELALDIEPNISSIKERERAAAYDRLMLEVLSLHRKQAMFDGSPLTVADREWFKKWGAMFALIGSESQDEPRLRSKMVQLVSEISIIARTGKSATGTTMGPSVLVWAEKWSSRFSNVEPQVSPWVILMILLTPFAATLLATKVLVWAYP